MPELRKDPVIGRWVIISAERGKRPSDFLVELERKKGGFCPFCEGNEDKTPPGPLPDGLDCAAGNARKRFIQTAGPFQNPGGHGHGRHY